ncbi:MAG: uridine kinase [Clostridia bacterium]|nr:uridine kinase [Clostridia bacterium]MBQ7407594.1 uridine kinase [Clostridia bacterium]
MKNKDTIFVGIAGGTGSGKTTLARHLKDAFGADACLIAHDSYYLDQSEKTYEERCKQNYDHPNAFETELLCRHLDLLAEGKEIDVPIYDYTVHSRAKESEHVIPARVVLLEGILILSDERIRERLDLKIFVDTDADERILRRIRRDTEERARSLSSVIDQYLTTVKPMHEAFVEPNKKHANIIVPGGGDNPVALEMICSHIRKFL